MISELEYYFLVEKSAKYKKGHSFQRILLPYLINQLIICLSSSAREIRRDSGCVVQANNLKIFKIFNNTRKGKNF